MEITPDADMTGEGKKNRESAVKTGGPGCPTTHFQRAQSLSRVPLCSPQTVARRAPLSVGFSQRECWSGLPCLPLGDLPDLGVEPVSPVSPLLQAVSLPAEPLGKPLTFNKMFIWTRFLF